MFLGRDQMSQLTSFLVNPQHGLSPHQHEKMPPESQILRSVNPGDGPLTLHFMSTPFLVISINDTPSSVLITKVKWSSREFVMLENECSSTLLWISRLFVDLFFSSCFCYFIRGDLCELNVVKGVLCYSCGNIVVCGSCWTRRKIILIGIYVKI